MSAAQVVIVGGGLAGLCCARELATRGVDFQLLEAADRVGGRVRTDEVDGFLLDRGFQVLLTAYPECRAVLDYPGLDLRPFTAGALVRRGGRFHRLADPWRAPLSALGSLLAPVGSVADKLRVGRLRSRLRRARLEEVFAAPERTTRAALEAAGFSPAMVDAFFRPFLGGIFLDPELATSSRMFEFVFKMFAEGAAALPAAGMEAIPRQLAAALPAGSVRTGARVESFAAGRVTLAGGEEIAADRVVVAADAAAARRLLPELAPRGWCATACFYFDAERAPIDQPILVLDGEGEGPVNNLCVPSAVAPGYAPAGRALVSATVVGSDGGDTRSAADAGPDLERRVRDQLGGWFGAAVDGWRTLAVYEIERALPAQPPGALEPPARPVRAAPGIYLAGDHLDTASIQGAMASGRRAAAALVDDLGGGGC